MNIYVSRNVNLKLSLSLSANYPIMEARLNFAPVMILENSAVICYFVFTSACLYYATSIGCTLIHDVHNVLSTVIVQFVILNNFLCSVNVSLSYKKIGGTQVRPNRYLIIFNLYLYVSCILSHIYSI